MKQLQVLKDSGNGVKVDKVITEKTASSIYIFIETNQPYIYGTDCSFIDNIMEELKNAKKRTPSIFKNSLNKIIELENNYRLYLQALDNDASDKLINHYYYSVETLLSDIMQDEQIADSILSENLIDYIKYIS